MSGGHFPNMRGATIRVMAPTFEPHEVSSWTALTRVVSVEEAGGPVLYAVVLAVIDGRARTCGLRCSISGVPLKFTQI